MGHPAEIHRCHNPKSKDPPCLSKMRRDKDGAPSLSLQFWRDQNDLGSHGAAHVDYIDDVSKRQLPGCFQENDFLTSALE